MGGGMRLSVGRKGEGRENKRGRKPTVLAAGCLIKFMIDSAVSKALVWFRLTL